MVSFSCEACGDVLTKKKLDPHRNQCRGATFTCLDCMVHFYGTEYRAHTSCISEAQKYQGHLYREKDNKKANKGEKRKYIGANSQYDSQAMVPRGAYVEDAPEDDSQAIAVVDVPPRAPTPPPAAASLEDEHVNVFDFLVTEDTPNGNRLALNASSEKRMLQESQYMNGDAQYTQHSQYSQQSNGHKPQYLQHGFSYGNAPVEPGFERYDSWQNMTESQQSQALMPPPPYVTPAPDRNRKDRKEKHTVEKSDKKRKRHQVEDLDLSSAKRPTSRQAEIVDPPTNGSGSRVLHSGLTGGLQKLVTDPDFYEDRIDAGPTPTSPMKRSKRDKDVRDDRRKSSYTSYSTAKSSTSRRSDDRSSQRRARSQEREIRPQYHDDKLQSRRRHRDSESSSDQHRASKHLKAIDYQPSSRPSSVQPTSKNQIVTYNSRAELFLSLINKGPESQNGLSINKVLKRYHREREVRGEEKEEEDKELWKNLRLRRNERGEIVLFL